MDWFGKKRREAARLADIRNNQGHTPLQPGEAERFKVKVAWSEETERILDDQYEGAVVVSARGLWVKISEHTWQLQSKHVDVLSSRSLALRLYGSPWYLDTP